MMNASVRGKEICVFSRCVHMCSCWCLESMRGPVGAWRGRRGHPLPTVHLCGFSPVCRRMWTTSMYWALKGFCSREQSSQRHTNSFFSPWMWSLLMCCGTHTHREMRGFSGESCPLRGSHVVPGLMFLWKSVLSAEISKEGCSRGKSNWEYVDCLRQWKWTWVKERNQTAH